MKLFDIFKRNKSSILDSITFKEVVSYTTRPMRDYETNGKEHIFISNIEADELLKHYRPAAYTEIGDVRYFVLKPQLKEGNLYIIDPKGIKSLLKNNYTDIKFVILYVNTSENIRNKRAKLRSGYNEKVYNERVAAENEQFFKFESDLFNDNLNVISKIKNVYYVNNNSDNINKTMKKVYKIIEKTYTPETIYLIVGRTCSGKDTICHKLVERNKTGDK